MELQFVLGKCLGEKPPTSPRAGCEAKAPKAADVVLDGLDVRRVLQDLWAFSLSGAVSKAPNDQNVWTV